MGLEVLSYENHLSFPRFSCQKLSRVLSSWNQDFLPRLDSKTTFEFFLSVISTFKKKKSLLTRLELVALNAGSKRIFFSLVLVEYLGNHDCTCVSWSHGRRGACLTSCFCSWFALDTLVSVKCMFHVLWLKWYLYKCYVKLLWFMNLPRCGCTLSPLSSPSWMFVIWNMNWYNLNLYSDMLVTLKCWAAACTTPYSGGRCLLYRLSAMTDFMSIGVLSHQPLILVGMPKTQWLAIQLKPPRAWLRGLVNLELVYLTSLDLLE